MEDLFKVYASEEYVDERVPDAPGAAHRVLVTDSSGTPMWEDRTHYEIVYTVNGVGNGSAYVKISDLTPSMDELNQEDTRVWGLHGGSGKTFDLYPHAISKWEESTLGGVTYVKLSGGQFNNVVNVVYEPAGDSFPEPGIYIKTQTQEVINLCKEIWVSFRRLVELDEKYIPSSIARVTDIPDLPTTTNANQQLVTDSDGNATWADRTLYATTSPEIAIAENVSVTTESDYSTNCCTDVTTKFVIGETYRVVFDDVTYDNLVCSQSEEEYVCIGGEIWTTGDETCPFTLTTSEYVDGIEVRALTEGAHTFSLYHKKENTVMVGQPNWEQNDPLAVDYIKGRTHYSYVVPGETIAENVAVTTELEYSTYCCEDVTTKFVLGTTYKVIFDGITYDNIACNQSDSEYVCVGGEIWTDGDDTYPFTMTTSEYSSGIEVRATTAGEHTFSVYSYDVTKYVGIPDEYLKRQAIFITDNYDGKYTFKLHVSTDGYLYIEDTDGQGISHRIATEEYVNNNSSNDDHINALIDAKLGVIENGTY